MEILESYTQKLISLGIEYAPKLLLAIITFIIGSFLIKKLVRILKKRFEKREVEKSLQGFLLSILKTILWAVLIISLAGIVGIQTTSFVAILGAAGLAVGLALQGSLANFAGGVLILLFKPFKVGDVVEAHGFLGIINDVQIFHTIMKTFDNRTIILPNGPLANSPIMNASKEEFRRADMEFGVSYSDDIDKVKQLLRDLIAADDRILNEPSEPFVALSTLGDSSVNFVVRVWTKASDLWPVTFDFKENAKKLFDREGVSIPFPQTDVHLYKE